VETQLDKELNDFAQSSSDEENDSAPAKDQFKIPENIKKFKVDKKLS